MAVNDTRKDFDLHLGRKNVGQGMKMQKGEDIKHLAYRVDPCKSHSWLIFGCEEDLKVKGLIGYGDRVITLFSEAELVCTAQRAGSGCGLSLCQ